MRAAATSFRPRLTLSQCRAAPQGTSSMPRLMHGAASHGRGLRGVQCAVAEHACYKKRDPGPWKQERRGGLFYIRRWSNAQSSGK